jgi:hypothetical protein
MFSEGGNEGWERFRKRQGKTLRKILSKARKLEKNKSKQVKRFGNVEVEEGMGAAYMPKAGTQGVPEREVTSKAVKKQLNRNRNRAQMKGDLETPSIRYTHSRDKSTDYIRPVKKKRIHKKKVKEAVDKNDTKGLKKLVKGLKGSSKAHLGQAKELDKMISDEYIPEGSKPNNPKLWAAKKAAAKAKFDVYPSAYANGWAAKQYKAAGGTWRSESVEYPERETLKQKQDNKTKSAQAAHQKRMIDGARKSISQYNTEDYNAMKNAQAHAKRDGSNYDRDVSVQHKYDAYHMKKAGYTHRKYGAYGSYSYNKHGDGEKITDKHHSGISESASENQQENIIAFPMARRAAQLTPQQKRKANADYKQKARDEIKNKMKKESFGDRGISLQELGDPDKMNQLFRMGLAKKGELQLMQRMMKRGPDALKDPKLRQKMYDLLVDLTDLVTKDGQTFVKVRQNVQKNKKELQAVKELLHYGGQAILEVNTAYKLINIPEDMSGMSVSSGHKRSVDSGAGMTQKGVAAYRRRNPGSKLKTAVTTPPSKLKKGSKAAKRRKAFCSRSKSWTGERGKAARRRWNC